MLVILAVLPVLAAGLRHRGALTPEALAPLCIEGKLVPELFLLGAQKAATSTFSHKLQSAGVGLACGRKECHAFDRKIKHWREHFREKWLQRMQDCPEEAAGTGRTMVADFTPAYLRLIPMPSGVRDVCPDWVHHMDEFLLSLYGAQARRLRFVVTLREPLARMHSAFSRDCYCVECRQPVLRRSEDQKIRHNLCSAPNFEYAVVRALQKARASPPVIEDWLWVSLYGLQLSGWLRQFEAEQFYVIPFKHMVKQSEQACSEMRTWLQLDLNCSAFAEPNHNNSAPPGYQLLEEAISPAIRQDFNSYIKEANENLLRLLSNTTGLHLGAYGGGSVEEWLKSGW